jgi:hypothetical protein
MARTQPIPELGSVEPNQHGYREFTLGQFSFARDEYFAHVRWPQASHMIPVDALLRAIQRDVAWGFFYGIVNFDAVVGTVNHYGTVELFAGRFNEHYRKSKRGDLQDGADPARVRGDPRGLDQRRLRSVRRPAGDRVGVRAEERQQQGGDHAPSRDGQAHDRRAGRRADPHGRQRLPGQSRQDAPEVDAEPGFEGEVVSFSLFAYLSRSDVTWNPSVVSVCKASLYCPTTEEYILPVIHGNDRVEWFVQLSDEIHWEVEDRDTGALRARVTMKPGDVAAMPADIRHRGFAPKRSMLLVWENASPELPALYAAGKMPPSPVQF